MAQYEYQGIDASGKSKKGILNADNVQAAKAQLKRDGIFISQILETSAQILDKNKQSMGFLSSFQNVPVEDLSLTTRQLATLISSHIPLIEALNALVEQTENPKLSAALSQVKSDVNEGLNFHKALSRFPEIFSDLFVGMIAAGENSGALDIVLNRLADFLEYQDRLRKKITSALFYPIIMLVVGFGAVMIIFTKVVPQIATIFEENQQALPLITEIVLTISHFLIDWWWAVILGIGLMIEGIRQFLRSEFGKIWWDRTQLELPIFGTLIRMVAVTRFTQTLSTLLKSGIPLLSCLSIVKAVVNNSTIARAIEQAGTDLTEGQSISNPLRKSGQFPPLMTHMISVGEKTGELETMLEKVAEHYEYRVNNSIQAMTSILEPVMIIFLAVIVLVIVLSVVLPMIQLNNIAI